MEKKRKDAKKRDAWEYCDVPKCQGRNDVDCGNCGGVFCEKHSGATELHDPICEKVANGEVL